MKWPRFLRLRAFLAVLGIGGGLRVLVGVLGIGGFVVGMILAWGRSSSTTLLIASAILLLFAAVGLDWNEILASWGSASVSLRRGLEHVDEGLELGEAGLEEVAAREEAEPVREELGVLRDQLEILRGQVRGLTSPPTPFSRFSIRTSSVSPLMESLLRGGTASHELQDNSVRLSLRSGSPHLGLPMHCQNAEWQQLQRRDNSTC